MDFPGLNPSLSKLGGFQFRKSSWCVSLFLEHCALPTLFYFNYCSRGLFKIWVQILCHIPTEQTQLEHGWKCNVQNSLQCSLSQPLPASLRKPPGLSLCISPKILLCSSSCFPGEFWGKPFRFLCCVEVEALLTLKGTLSEWLCPALLGLIDFLLPALPLITFLLLSHFHPFQLFLLFQPFLMPPAPTWWIGCSESGSWPGLGPSPGNQWCHTDRKWCPNKHPAPFAPLPTGTPPGVGSQLNADEMEEREIKTKKEKLAFCVDLVTWKFCTYP